MTLAELNLFRRTARILGGFLLLATALLICPAAIAQIPAPSGLSSNRYLIILDTSRTMKPRVPGIVSTLSNLFEGSLAQQLRTGDTLGVWTFNSELITGELPLQKWTTNQQSTVRDQVLRFAGSRTYEKKADFGQVQLALDRVLQSSELLTVIVITSGETPIQGTPFNDSINSILEQWQSELREQQKPIVVVLRGNSGKWTHHSVSPAPFPVELPTLPKLTVAEATPPKPAEPTFPKTPPSTNQAPQRVLPPLIVSGKAQTPDSPVPSATLSTDAVVPPPAPQKTGDTASRAPESFPAIATPNPQPNALPVVPQPPAPTPVVPMEKADQKAVSPPAEMPNKAVSSDTTPSHKTETVSEPSGTTVAAAAPEPKATSTKRLLFLACAAAGLLLLLTVFVIWRWQRPHQPSLITRSLERKP
jgi:hypothetical protein